MHWLAAFLTVLAAYLIGAIPFGFLVARWRGVNIYEHGSGNIGATNVGRVLGWKFGIFVFVLDFAKGAVPVALALILKPYFDEEELWARGYVEVAAGLLAFLGHLYPIYLRFRGGKGVATGAGAVVVLAPLPAAVALAVWCIAAYATRYVSLASILAVVALWAAQVIQPSSWNWLEPRTWFCLVAGGLVVVRHRANIVRLLKGTESQIKETAVMQQLSKSLHVLALGLWFGASVFFTFVVALSLFNTFPTLAKQDIRESWFPRPEMYQHADAHIDGPDEQGKRAAGYAVGPIFLWYFALQGACGFVALATALTWLKFEHESRVHRWRVNLLLVAVALLVISWPIERHVTSLRSPRNLATEQYLQDPADDAKLQEMRESRGEFNRWHGYSMILNFLIIISVTSAMALAGNLPTRSPASVPPPAAPPEPAAKQEGSTHVQQLPRGPSMEL